MIRFVIPLSLLASAGHAEGRNDPFLKCDFLSGRQVVLAENGAAVEWREGQTTRPARIIQDSGEGEERTVTIAPTSSTPSFLYITGFAPDGSAKAALTATKQNTSGAFEITSDSGACKEFFG